MKITNAFVHDPTASGRLEHPVLTVQVDEWPGVTIPPESFSGGWTVGKYGPFVRYAQHDQGAMMPSPVDAGDFNVRFRTRFPVVVDIALECQVLNYDAHEDGLPEWETNFDYSLPLTRARQLVKKYDPDWKLVLSDRDAQAGALLWSPVRNIPDCRYWLGKSTCGQRPARTIRVGEVDLPLCDTHVREHNERHAAKRTAASR